MHDMDWDNVRHFLEVVRAGSASRAAQSLGVNQTTVSRRIASLETQLGKKLFDRSGNGWLITPVGERLVASAEQMAVDAHAIERQILADSQELSGRLRLTVADVCSQHLAMPAIQAFTQRYPDVDVEIIATNELLDLAAREADVALRSTNEPPSNVVGKRIGRLAYAVYGTQELLRRVRRDTDGGDSPCITWSGDGQTRPTWIEKSFPTTRRVYRTNSLGVMLKMATEGIGLAQLPRVLGDMEPRLHRVPARYVEPGWGLWVLSHVDLRTTARVRIFRDFLVAHLEGRKDLIEGRANSMADSAKNESPSQ